MIRYPVSRPSLTHAEREAVLRCFHEDQITQGQRVVEFEEALAAWHAVPHAIACSSGTSALHLALLALGVGPGDEVLVPDLTFVATVNAIAYCGATPVLVDIDPDTWGMDVAIAQRLLTKKTKAALIVHLFGRRARIDLPVPILEDAAEALGGIQSVNGAAMVLSFYANKIITTGEGGAVLCRDPKINNTVRLLRGQGQTDRYYHPVRGFNYRMTDLQGAIGCAQWRRFDGLLRSRARVFQHYERCLGRCQFPYTSRVTDAPWQYVVGMPEGVNRRAVIERLNQSGIETRPAFVPMHRLPMYQASEKLFPVASLMGDHALMLPTYPGLLPGDIEKISDALLRAVQREAA